MSRPFKCFLLHAVGMLICLVLTQQALAAIETDKKSSHAAIAMLESP